MDGRTAAGSRDILHNLVSISKSAILQEIAEVKGSEKVF